MTAGLILAAGESRRMGSPKALLQFRGTTFLDRLIELFARQCSPVLVVLGAHGEIVRAGLQRASEARFIENPDFRRGQLSSMQCGLQAVPAAAGGVLFTLVDHPAVSPATVAALTEADAPDLLRIPRYQGKRGHPIWFSRSLTPEFLALPVTSAARDVVTRHADEIAYLDVDDPGVTADIDDPDEYRRLIS